MKLRTILLLGCILMVNLVFAHRHGGNWDQNGGGGWGPHGGGGRSWSQHGGGGGWGQHGGGGDWRQHGGGGRGQYGGGGGWGRHGHGGWGRQGGSSWGQYGVGGSDNQYRKNRGQPRPFVNFEVKVPQGLEVSMVQQNTEVTIFGIEVYVNKDAESGNGCDICQNTTTIDYGKFIIEDVDAVIKKGDVLLYIVLLGNATSVTRYPPQRLYVTESIIDKCNCQNMQDPDIDVRFSTDDSSGVSPSTTEPEFEFHEFERIQQFSPEHADLMTRDWQREVQVLEEIIEQMKSGCGSKHASNLILLKQSPQRTSDAAELLNFVKSSMAVNAEMQELANGIQRLSAASSSGQKAVVFGMGSYVDKQKVLYHAILNNLVQFVDYDQASE